MPTIVVEVNTATPANLGFIFEIEQFLITQEEVLKLRELRILRTQLHERLDAHNKNRAISLHRQAQADYAADPTPEAFVILESLGSLDHLKAHFAGIQSATKKALRGLLPANLELFRGITQRIRDVIAQTLSEMKENDEYECSYLCIPYQPRPAYLSLSRTLELVAAQLERFRIAPDCLEGDPTSLLCGLEFEDFATDRPCKSYEPEAPEPVEEVPAKLFTASELATRKPIKGGQAAFKKLLGALE